MPTVSLDVDDADRKIGQIVVKFDASRVPEELIEVLGGQIQEEVERVLVGFSVETTTFVYREGHRYRKKLGKIIGIRLQDLMPCFRTWYCTECERWY